VTLRTLRALISSIGLISFILFSTAILRAEPPNFLVAKPDLPDPLFEESVILMIPALVNVAVDGLIINKPVAIRIKRIFPNALELGDPANNAFFGGPVEPDGNMLVRRTSSPISGEQKIFADLYLSFDPKVIATLLKDPHLNKSNARLFVGYAQWSIDQLRAEKMEGSWYDVPADPNLVFADDPKTLWRKLADRARVQKVCVAPCK